MIKRLNNSGFAHHFLLLALLIVIGFVTFSAYTIISSSANVATEKYAIGVGTQKGCDLAGRKYTQAGCLRECQYPNAEGVKYKELDGKSGTGFCVGYINTGVTPTERDWCLNAGHRYFIDKIGCAKKRGQETNANNHPACQPEYPNYVTQGSKDVCVANPVTAHQTVPVTTLPTPSTTAPSTVSATQVSPLPTSSSSSAAASNSSAVPIVTSSTGVVETNTILAFDEPAALPETTAALAVANGNTCPVGKTASLIQNDNGEMSVSCLGQKQAKNCTSKQVLTARAGSYQCQARKVADEAAKKVNYDFVDPRIGDHVCKLLGRLPVEGYKKKNGDRVPGGCSRKQCLNKGDDIKASPNAEVCFKGGPNGPAYGTTILFDRCRKLNRVWVPIVNYCISNPQRGKKIVHDAPQCVAPYTDYVIQKEDDDTYDECLKPSTVRKIQSIAKKTGTPFRKVAESTSRTLCSFKDYTMFVDGKCINETRPVDQSTTAGTLMIGDSITWRGTNELRKLHPSWTVDGIPYRTVNKLPFRIKDYLAGHPAPAVLIVALGTNPSTGWSQQDYENAVSLVPESTRVVFVLPYRQPGPKANAKAVESSTSYAQMMRNIASKRPNTCLSDWRQKAIDHPKLLVDGIHQTTEGEKIWAKSISGDWQRCVTS